MRLVLGDMPGEALLHVLEVEVEGPLRQLPSGVGQTHEHRTAVVGIGPLGRLMSAMGEADKAHVKALPEPHWYLAGATVDPSVHGRGIGTALVNHGLERVDAQGGPCYLETSNERNVAYWQRFGFDVAFHDSLGKGSVPCWGMIRPAAS